MCVCCSRRWDSIPESVPSSLKPRWVPEASCGRLQYAMCHPGQDLRLSWDQITRMPGRLVLPFSGSGGIACVWWELALGLGCAYVTDVPEKRSWMFVKFVTLDSEIQYPLWAPCYVWESVWSETLQSWWQNVCCHCVDRCARGMVWLSMTFAVQKIA